MRIQRVVLEDHRDVTILRGDLVHDPVTDPDSSLADLLEPGDHAERRGLAAAGRADEDHELALADRELELIDGAGPVGVDLGDLVEADRSHVVSP